MNSATADQVGNLVDSKSKLRVRHALGVLVALAVILKAIFFVRLLIEPTLAVGFGDPGSYYELAVRLYHEHRLENSYRPILFPLIYAVVVGLFGKSAPLVMVLINYVVSILTGITLYRLVPASGTINVTLALTGLGSVYFDDVRIEPLLRKLTAQAP